MIASLSASSKNNGRRKACRALLAAATLLGTMACTNATAAPNRLHHGGYETGFGTINACAAYQDQNNRWSDDFRIELSYYDGDHLSRLMRSYRYNNSHLYAVFYIGPRDPIIIDLQTRPGFSTSATTIQDVEGNRWRISRSWQRCSR